MSHVSLMGPAAAGPPETFEHRIVDDPQSRWEQWWQWVSERLNPIVVKEVRQALKSRQFTLSFGLTLMAAVAWTLIAVALMVPRMYYIPAGVPLLSGYFCILAVPLMVIVPFGAFRSLTSETDDSTFELLSISALSALQIVHGKMASAAVQIVLYLSALAPCIVLTYLLRGVGLYTILVMLGWTVGLAFGETALGLLLGAVARTRMLQVGAAVLALLGLFLGIFAWLTFVLGVGVQSFANPRWEEVVIWLALASILVASVWLVLRAAAAAIDFPSENHSTPLRRRLLVWTLLVCFWSLLGTLAVEDMEAANVLLVGLFIFLMVVGSLVSGERGILSPRAQRGLPQTYLGRTFLTWFYPGAGLGTIFVLCLYAAVVGTVCVMDVVYRPDFQSSSRDEASSALGWLLLGHLTVYVGLNRLLMMLVPPRVPSRMLASVALMAAVLIVGHLLPLFFAYYANDYRDFDYAWHQAFNIVWSIQEISRLQTSQIATSMLMVTLCAIAVFGLNLVFCTRDVMLVRVAVPPRIREEERRFEPASPAPVDPFAD